MEFSLCDRDPAPGQRSQSKFRSHLRRRAPGLPALTTDSLDSLAVLTVVHWRLGHKLPQDGRADSFPRGKPIRNTIERAWKFLLMNIDRKLPRIALVDDHPAVLHHTVNLLSPDFDIVIAA